MSYCAHGKGPYSCDRCLRAAVEARAILADLRPEEPIPLGVVVLKRAEAIALGLAAFAVGVLVTAGLTWWVDWLVMR